LVLVECIGGNQNESSASIDDTSSRFQNSLAIIFDTLVNTPVSTSRRRLGDGSVSNVTSEFGRIRSTKGEFAILISCRSCGFEGDRYFVSFDGFLDKLFSVRTRQKSIIVVRQNFDYLREEIIGHSWNRLGVRNSALGQIDGTNTKNTVNISETC
jgi:hypothetical protein